MLVGLGRGIWERLQEGLEVSMNGSAGAVQGYFSMMFGSVVKLIEQTFSFIKSIGRILITPIKTVWGLLRPIAALLGSMFGDSEGEAEGYADTLGGIMNIFGGMLDSVNSFIDGIVGDLEGFSQSFSSFYDETFGPFIEALERDLPDAKDTLMAVWDDIYNTFSDFGSALYEIGSVLWDVFSNTFSVVFDLISDTVGSLFGRDKDSAAGKAEWSFKNIGDNAAKMWGKIKPLLAKMLQGFLWVFENITIRWLKTVVTMWGKISEFFIHARAGVDLMRNAWTTLQEVMVTGWNAVKVNVRGALNIMVDEGKLAFKKIMWTIQKVFTSIKISLAEGIFGVLDRIQGVLRSMGPTVRGMIPGADSFFESVTSSSRMLRQSIAAMRVDETQMLRNQEREQQRISQNIRDTIGASEGARAEARRAMEEGQRENRNIMRERDASLRRNEQRTRRGHELLDEGAERVRGTIERFESGEFGRTRQREEEQRRLRDREETRRQNEQMTASILEGLSEQDRRRFGRQGITGLELALQARQESTGRALDRQEVDNIIRTVQAVGRGTGMSPAEKREQTDMLVRAVAEGERIARPTQPRPRRRGRNVRRTQQQREAQQGTDGPTEVSIVNVEPQAANQQNAPLLREANRGFGSVLAARSSAPVGNR